MPEVDVLAAVAGLGVVDVEDFHVDFLLAHLLAAQVAVDQRQRRVGELTVGVGDVGEGAAGVADLVEQGPQDGALAVGV